MAHWYRLLLLGTFTGGIAGVGIDIGADGACVSASGVLATSTIAAGVPAWTPESVMEEAQPQPPATLPPASTHSQD
jgi:hypothetical protein